MSTKLYSSIKLPNDYPFKEKKGCFQKEWPQFIQIDLSYKFSLIQKIKKEKMFCNHCLLIVGIVFY